MAASKRSSSESLGRHDGRPEQKADHRVEAYFADLGRVRASGGTTEERSHYPALAGLLRAVGSRLKPKVFCVLELADQGAGHPDLALYTARQVQKGHPRPGQVPERGVVEVKGVGDSARLTAESDQMSRYRDRYGLVLVTNYGASSWWARTVSEAPPSSKPSAWPRMRTTSGGRWPSPRTWRGCWLPTPVTAWPASRRRATFHPCWPYGRRWRRCLGFGSRASAGNVSSVRP